MKRVSVVLGIVGLGLSLLLIGCTFIAPTQACTPMLLTPVDGAIMDNGRYDSQNPIVWEFEWAGCPQATAYRLFVIYAGGGMLGGAVVNEVITTTTYTYRTDTGVVANENAGWIWQVQAQVDGVWGGWSQVRAFRVEPADTDPPN